MAYDEYKDLARRAASDKVLRDMAYDEYKDLARRAASDKVLRDKAFDIAKNPKHDIYQRGLASMIYKFFNKKTPGGVIKNEIKQNKYKDLARRAASDKVLRDKAFDIAKNPKHDIYQRGLASMIYKFFNKKTPGGVIKNEIKQNVRPLDLAMQQLAEESHKPIIRKFKKRKVYSSFKDNIWGADLADMQLMSKFNKGFRFLLCVIDIFS